MWISKAVWKMPRWEGKLVTAPSKDHGSEDGLFS